MYTCQGGAYTHQSKASPLHALAHSPEQGGLDGRGQAGGEEVGREVRVHREQLLGAAGRHLDAVVKETHAAHLRGGALLGEKCIFLI